mmetsp:Transcript_68594/g.143088  ORF Transcript_68594/g.143088 Transcript_68594/m.143088 type:complete len:626 (+) Transcript_68594:330-2207(+)
MRQKALRQEWSIPPSPAVMWKLQAALPRLPVPDLGQTLIRYLQSVRPLLADEEFSRTVKAVSDFAVSGQGDTLQARLRKRAEAKKDSSWLVEWWNQIAYLTDRGPVVFYVSYFFGFKPLPKVLFEGALAARISPQCIAAAAIIDAGLEFKQMVHNETLPPDMNGGSPECMAVYLFLFNACRIPATRSDIVATYNPRAYRHILVSRRGRFYAVEVEDDDGQRLSRQSIAQKLMLVVEEADRKGAEQHPVGVLTGGGREEWGKARTELLADEGNRRSLELIQSSALLVCLDHQAPAGGDVSGRARQYWHGDGRNRYYDKTLQFVVCGDGRVGFLGEHAMADGAPTLRLCKHIIQASASPSSASTPATREASPSTLPPPKELPLRVEGTVAAAIQAAAAQFDATKAAHSLERISLEGLGRDGIKRLGVGPDGFCQLAIQLAFFSLQGRLAPTYEACSTRKFLHGRTETIRSCTREAATFIKAMAAKTGSVEERRALLLAAVAAHQQQARDCSSGRGVDRHLLGLKLLVKEGEPEPALFQDAAFARSKTWELSTSNLSAEELESWGYGEVVPDGFGVAYSILRASTTFTVTSRVGKGGENRSVLLAAKIREAMKDIEALCVAVGARAKL